MPEALKPPGGRTILVVTRNLPPLVGGMERLNLHLIQELARAYRVCVCGPEDCARHLPPAVTVAATFAVQPPALFLGQSLLQTLQVAFRLRPDLLIAGSGVTAPACVIAGALLRVPVLAYLHGLDIVADSLIYQRGFLPFIRRCRGFLVNSRHTARLAETAGIAGNRIQILHPCVELPDFAAQADAERFRQSIGAGARPILLSVGRLTPRKGLLSFIQRCLPAIVAAKPDVLLLIIGGEADQRFGAAAANMTGQLRQAAQSLGLAGHVLLLGRVSDEVLIQSYRASRLHVFPVIAQPHDVEGFGMVAVEAAAHGLPTVAFAAGGVPDAVAEGVSGWLAEPGDYDRFSRIIIEQLGGADQRVDALSCRRFAENFGWERFGARLRAICQGYLPS